ncbi:MAG: exodeoxyribonuclease VII large subunit [Actinomycetota bacterium]
MSEQTLTVSELGIVVRAALEQAMPYGVWVEGEIQGITRSRNGHVYFDMIEPAEASGAAPLATVPVVLFRDARDRVNRLLKRHGDPIRMTDGVKIRIQGMVDFYPPSGRIQLRMSAIDPTYTLGVLAAEREALLRQLSDSGRLRANARHAVPNVPLRIGVVTSIGSAAHADVTTVFERSERAFTLVEIDTAVQGAGAERTIAAAVRAAVDASVDVVLVVRGGGSKTDLAVFDHAEVADAIADAPVPVFTGVGHDIDRSVADEVAHTAHTTPTAAAQAIVAVVDDWLARLAGRETEIAHRTRRALTHADLRLDQHQAELLRATGRAGAAADARLADASGRLRRAAVRAETTALAVLDQAATRIDLATRHGLRAAELKLDTAEARTKALDPAIALARGWSITRGPDGAVVRSVADVAPGAELTTQVADGTISSTIPADE